MMPKKTAQPTIAKAAAPVKPTRTRVAPPAPPEPPPATLTFEAPNGARVAGKMARLVELLIRTDGATIAELCDAVSWQKHSVRGALAGALKKLGYDVVSDKPADLRRYRIVPLAPLKFARGKKAPAGGGR
jgi:hypothetical protein